MGTIFEELIRKFNEALNMVAHAKEPKEGGSRIAIIMNGSPLFTGDAGSGESEIRRFILENDWLEALIALPEQLFYNTGIATYVWVVTPQSEATQGPRAADRCHVLLGADAQEPRRQAA
ncbi:MAG: N-6 DNA methylase [Steroidobacteraceae bacterium]